MSGLAFLLQILARIWWYCEVFATIVYVVFLCWKFKCSRSLCLGALKWHREHSILIQLSPLSPLVTVPLTISNPREKTLLQSYTTALPAMCCLWGFLLPQCPLRERLPGCPWVRASSLLIPESHFTTQSSVFLASSALMCHFRLWAISLIKLPLLLKHEAHLL